MTWFCNAKIEKIVCEYGKWLLYTYFRGKLQPNTKSAMASFTFEISLIVEEESDTFCELYAWSWSSKAFS